jgi:hypothetical protein
VLEKDIENLLAQYPNDFFPGEQFSLISQQYSIEGKRIDILFRDKLNRKIIVEVKRGILTREASGQIAEYYGLLKSRDQNEYYELILCANIIPKERRVFLEHIGIECKELGIAYISEVAKNHQYTFSDDQPSLEAPQPAASWDTFSENLNPDEGEISVWIFQANPQRYDILNALSDEEIGNNIHWLVNQHRKRIKKGHLGLIWMCGNDAGIYAITRIDSDPRIAVEYFPEKKYWADSSEKNEALRVEMTVLRRLVNKPVLKNTLTSIESLKDLSILRQFRGTNFPVKNSEWKTISNLISN